MKLHLLLLLLVLFATPVWCQDEEAAADDGAAAGEGEEGGDEEGGEYSAPAPIADEDLADNDSLMKLLRSGEEEVMEIIYVIGITDSKQTGAKQKEWAEEMQNDLKMFNFEDVTEEDEEAEGDEAAEGDAAAEGDEAAARR